MNGSPQVGGYSFYLNVVVINTNPSENASTRTESGGSGNDENTTIGPRDGSVKEEPSNDSVELLNEEPSDQMPDEPAGSGAEGADNSATAVTATANVTGRDMIAVGLPRTEDPKLKLLVESKALMDFAFGRRGSQRGGMKKKEGPGFMSTLGNSISKSSSNISKRASRFVANKTMVSRAEKAVVECIPLVTEEIGVEMSISKRFQQGPVFVLEVDMKGCEMLDLLEKVQGEEAAKHYAAVKAGLEFLDLPDAQDAFLKEILPKLRIAMMERMSEIVPEKMKLKKAYSDLEIQCVALEDAEEAKWLYNFLAFMEEMK